MRLFLELHVCVLQACVVFNVLFTIGEVKPRELACRGHSRLGNPRAPLAALPTLLPLSRQMDTQPNHCPKPRSNKSSRIMEYVGGDRSFEDLLNTLPLFPTFEGSHQITNDSELLEPYNPEAIVSRISLAIEGFAEPCIMDNST